MSKITLYGRGTERAIVKSPMNYTGGKTKLLDTILPLFPSDPTLFLDVFAGGLNVGLNAQANRVHFNDHNKLIIELYKYFKNNSLENILLGIDECVERYKLTKINQQGFLELRKHYNQTKEPLELFVLCCFSYNHQIRFNNDFQYNSAFGHNRCWYNDNTKNNLIAFHNILQSKKATFSAMDFRQLDMKKLTCNDFVYCDPPYLITDAVYNDANNKRCFGNWTQKEEDALYQVLDALHEQGVPFALSNVFSHKGDTNDTLKKWSEKYHVLRIDTHYKNCSHNGKSQTKDSEEVLIYNYKRR